MRLRNGLAAGAALLLAACGNSDTASFMLDGAETALTLERVKPYAWSDGWELQLTVRRNPECQRRHPLKATAGETTKIDLFTPAPNIFIIRQAKRWYVTDLKSCALQAYKEAPPEPGDPVGSFEDKDGSFKFVKIPEKAGS